VNAATIIADLKSALIVTEAILIPIKVWSKWASSRRQNLVQRRAFVLHN